MRTRIMGVLLVVIAGASLALGRTLSFKSGAALEAEVVSVGTDSVTVRRASDGKVYSVPLAYLADNDRVELAAERAKQWEPIEVMKLAGTASAGRYKRCAVRGTNIVGEILVDRLPAPVETILKERNRQETQIADLSAQIENRERVVERADAVTPLVVSGDLFYANQVMAQRAQVNLAMIEVRDAKTNLARLQDSSADYFSRTRPATTVPMRNTGLVYDGLPVWECLDPRKPQ